MREKALLGYRIFDDQSCTEYVLLTPVTYRFCFADDAQNVTGYAVTVNSPFQHLNLAPELACEFLAVFSRYEFALKSTGFAEGDAVQAAWDRYAGSIATAFDQITDTEVTAAVDYLLTQPPKKQVLREGKLQWESTPLDNVPRAQQVLTMIRRVRNNLFHGGKFIPAEAGGDPHRDQLLVQHSLVVLRACLPLDPNVEAAFSN